MDTHRNPTKRRRRRAPGSFICHYNQCGKSFSRAEHLARHQLNHNPSVIYECDWELCSRTFVRSDLRDRHMKRHVDRARKQQQKRQQQRHHTISNTASSTANIKGMKTISFGATAQPQASSPNVRVFENGSSIGVSNLDVERNSTTSSGTHSASSGTQNPELHSAMSIVNIITKPESPHGNELHQNEALGLVSSEKDDSNLSHFGSSSLDNISSWIDINFMNSLTDFTTQHMHESRKKHGLNYGTNTGFYLGLPSNTYMDDILSLEMPTETLIANESQDYSITPETMARIFTAIPSLSSFTDANIPAFQRCLQIYWKLFHVQFPFLHRPSFVANEAPELLLLAMVMLSAGLVWSTGEIESGYFSDPKALADAICVPLRWKLFESNDFTLPAKIWLVQSLLMLEYYEKYFSNRLLHERTFIHHGVLVQILRRSPTLGGNPAKSDLYYNPKKVSEEFSHKSDEEKRKILWQKWIEYESLKRTTLMAFYIDSTHFIIFGHLGMLNAHQVQLELPCDDDLWESKDLNYKPPPDNLKPKLFLEQLQNLLKRKPVNIGVFGGKILMAGLLAIISQFQQRDLQISALAFEDKKIGSWKEYLGYILDYFTHDVMGGCCETTSSVVSIDTTVPKSQLEITESNYVSLAFHRNDPRCKYPTYHAAHIIIRIPHYDLVLYSGAPWRLSVLPSIEDYNIVKARVLEWIDSPSDRVAVIHAYLILFEMFLPPENYNDSDITNYKYECLSDPFFERAYVLYLAILTIWTYCFTSCGPECTILVGIEQESIPEVDVLPHKEDGYSYLRRIRGELTKKSGKSLHTFPSLDGKTFHNVCAYQAKVLPEIPGKQNVIGFLKLMTESLIKSNWQLAREFKFLFTHMIERSCGSKAYYAKQYYDYYNSSQEI